MRFTSFAASAGSILSLWSAAQANTITGYLWHVPEAISQNAIPANVPGTIPDVVFDVDSPLSFSNTSATVGKWLATGDAFNIVENTPGTLASPMDDGTQGTFLKFTGFVTVHDGQNFRVTHDDGLSLIIGGKSLAFNPGPTAPAYSIATYSGPSGTFPFELDYAECCGGPAVLLVDLPFANTRQARIPEVAGSITHIPEGGASVVLFGMGLIGLFSFSRRTR